jgi:hypothetical protein
MAITLTQLRAHVRRRFEQDTTVRLEDERLDEAINEGMVDLAENTEFYERNATVNQIAGRTYYDLRGVLSPNFIRPKAVYNSQTGLWLEKVASKELVMDRWELDTGDARVWFARGLYHLGVHPHTNANAGTFKIYYSCVPSELVSGSDTVTDLPADHGGAIELYALYDLYAQEGLTEMAMKNWELYGEAVASLRDQTTRRVVRARSGTMGRRR